MKLGARKWVQKLFEMGQGLNNLDRLSGIDVSAFWIWEFGKDLVREFYLFPVSYIDTLS